MSVEAANFSVRQDWRYKKSLFFITFDFVTTRCDKTNDNLCILNQINYSTLPIISISGYDGYEPIGTFEALLYLLNGR